MPLVHVPTDHVSVHTDMLNYVGRRPTRLADTVTDIIHSTYMRLALCSLEYALYLATTMQNIEQFVKERQEIKPKLQSCESYFLTFQKKYAVSQL